MGNTREEVVLQLRLPTSWFGFDVRQGRTGFKHLVIDGQHAHRGIFVASGGETVAEDITVQNCAGGAGGAGGAVYGQQGSILVANSSFRHNTAEVGGALCINIGGAVNLSKASAVPPCRDASLAALCPCLFAQSPTTVQ